MPLLRLLSSKRKHTLNIAANLGKVFKEGRPDDIVFKFMYRVLDSCFTQTERLDHIVNLTLVKQYIIK